MIKQGDVIGYKKTNDFKGIVLEEILNFLSKKYGFIIFKLPNKKTTKIAVNSSLDSESNEIVKSIIQGNASDLKRELPVEGKIIKPLYLFLDEEILLYAKLRNLKFSQYKGKKDKIHELLTEFEKTHPEVKRAVVNSLLRLYSSSK